jgi:hypothetical protein
VIERLNLLKLLVEMLDNLPTLAAPNASHKQQQATALRESAIAPFSTDFSSIPLIPNLMENFP